MPSKTGCMRPRPFYKRAHMHLFNQMYHAMQPAIALIDRPMGNSYEIFLVKITQFCN